MLRNISLKKRQLIKDTNKPLFSYLDEAVSISGNRSIVRRTLFTLLTCGIFVLLRVTVPPVIGGYSEFILGLPTVFIVAWFAGLGPAIFTICLTFLSFLFFTPNSELSLNNFQTNLRLFLYIVESIFITGIIHLKDTAHVKMQRQAAHQAVIAALGQFGMEQNSIQLLLGRSLRAVQQTLAVDYSTFWEIEPNENQLRMISGHGWNGNSRRARLSTMSISHLRNSFEQRKPIIFSKNRKLLSESDKTFFDNNNIISGVTIPLVGSSQIYGALAVYNKHNRTFTKDEINFLKSVGNVLLTTIERQNTHRALQLIANTSDVLTRFLEPRKALTSVIQTLVPEFADVSEIYVRHKGGRTELIEVAAIKKEKKKILQLIAEKYPPHIATKRPSAKVFKEGKAYLVKQLDKNWEDKVAIDEEHKKYLKKLQLHSLIVVPLKNGKETVGVLTFGLSEQNTYYSEKDLIIAKEIAGRVAIALENSRLYQEVSDAVQARDEFLSIASHELKTPLTSMLLQLQSVLHSIKNESLATLSIDKNITLLESTINQSKRLTKLVNDLLNISLITTGKMSLEKEKIDLKPIVEDVVSRMSEQAATVGSTISLTTGKSIKGMYDKVRIEQVIINLITNAIKYGGGKPIDVKLTNSNSVATLIVEDHGMGIAEDKQKLIFERFERGDVKRSQKGLGVGLYMVNSIVKAHGGHINVYSTPKKGSRFLVELPAFKN